ncbi:MAG: hypothetical protein PHH22_03925 [Clostridia bacterium]|nr:hypothetical protein [Clostridia bacterium]
MGLSISKRNEMIVTNIVILVIIELFLGFVFFEWNQSLNIKMNCYISGGIISIVSIILLALGIGNKNKFILAYGIELLILAVITFLAYYILTSIIPIFVIGSVSLYVILPFVLFGLYYILKCIWLYLKA